MYSPALPYKDYNEGRAIIGAHMGRDFLEEKRKLVILEEDPLVKEYIAECKELRKNWIYVDALVKINREGNEHFIKEEWFSRGFDERPDRYGLFQSEDDFEYWQPVTTMDKNTPEYRIKYLRMLWIISRFPEWGEMEWAFMMTEYEALMKIVREENEIEEENGIFVQEDVD